MISTPSQKLKMVFSDVYDLVDENQNQIVLKQILKGLQYIHSQNLIHRDLKVSEPYLELSSCLLDRVVRYDTNITLYFFLSQPKNIFLMNTSSGALHAKVGDFGLARHVDSSDVPLTPHPGRASKFIMIALVSLTREYCLFLEKSHEGIHLIEKGITENSKLLYCTSQDHFMRKTCTLVV